MRRRIKPILAAFAAFALASCTPPSGGSSASGYNVEEKSIAQLQADLTSGAVSSEQLVQAYTDRINRIDRAGPGVNAVITLNPDALAQARALDQERKSGHARGPLHGIPVLVKDNIETQDNMATTAGSLALAGNVTHRDAPLVARLRAAGAIILGKTNLSEWANIRSNNSTSGWSGVGGLTHNPYVLDRNACGSSSGRARGSPRAWRLWASARRRMAPSPVRPRSTASPASSRPWASFRALTSCRSAIARTRPARWAAASPTSLRC